MQGRSCMIFSASLRLCERLHDSPLRRGRKFTLADRAAYSQPKVGGFISGEMRRIWRGAASFGARGGRLGEALQ
jgi:hypothetical protein